MSTYSITLDGQARSLEGDPAMPLLYALRNEFALRGPKFGCGVAQCGACTVIMNGAAVRSCVVPLAAIDGATIRTLDGLGTGSEPHPVQSAFIEEQATQCGYCVNGWIMTAVARLEKDPVLSEPEIRELLRGVKCRCGAHMAMLRAVRRAADAMAAMAPSMRS